MFFNSDYVSRDERNAVHSFVKKVTELADIAPIYLYILL